MKKGSELGSKCSEVFIQCMFNLKMKSRGRNNSRIGTRSGETELQNIAIFFRHELNYLATNMTLVHKDFFIYFYLKCSHREKTHKMRKRASFCQFTTQMATTDRVPLI